MKKNIHLLILVSFLFFTACNTATPEQYFDRAVLNSNTLVGFAGERPISELEYPSVKMAKDGSAVPMQRKEILDQKIKFMEEDFAKLKGLEETAETKEMLQASIAIYEYVLPVLKTEYAQLANAYDEAASPETIKSETQVIHEKYYTHYNELYQKLIGIGKVYAAKHSIKVNWSVGA